jgi:hypothetical protein
LQLARQRFWEKERGGQLFADVSRPDGVWLALATPPHPADSAGRSWLVLDPERCRREIEHANANGLRLIGYWHTHPQRVPSLSAQDSTSFHRFAQRYRKDLPHPLAVIVGQSLRSDGIRAWSIRDGRCHAASRVDALLGGAGEQA